MGETTPYGQYLKKGKTKALYRAAEWDRRELGIIYKVLESQTHLASFSQVPFL
jgi:hypothetical protein